MDSTSGSYMVESYNPNDYRPVYVMKGAGPNDQLLEFDVDADVAYNLVGRYYSLPFFCVGTGHAVFRRHFYCHKSASNRVVKYHLKRMDIVSELVLPGAAWADPAVAGHSDIDLAVDEFGLWALYATHSSAGKLVISKINHRLMEVERTWQTSYPLHLLGKSFLVCGVLYATDSVKDTPTFLRYVYNTETGKEQILEPGDMPFPNFAPLVSPEDGTTTGGSQGQPGWRGKDNSNTSMLSYDFRQSKLFAWNNGRIEAFPIYFKDMP
ncbi:noelin-2 [Aplysia californica]|nr:noelin-2 [Aplysia californica]